MKTSDQLKQERASEIKKQEALLKKAEGENNRDFTEDEQKEFRALDATIENLTNSIKDAEVRESAQRRNAEITASNVAPNIHRGSSKEQKPASLLRGLSDLANGKGLSGPEAELDNECREQMKGQGIEVGEGLRFTLPLHSEKRAQTVSDDSGGKGGALVPSIPRLVQPLQPNLPIESLGVTVLRNLVGDLPLPTSGSFSFSYVGETTDVSATDVSIAGPTLKPKRCSGVVEISRKLLLQTDFSVEAWIIDLINTATGNAITSNAISGPGTNAPTGLYDLITTNINTTAGTPTHATIVDLESLVDAADGTNVNRGYLSDTKLRALMKTTKIDAGSGIFLSDGKELNGYKYTASTLVDTLDAGASHPLIFGDWAQLFVGYWGNISIMVDPYTKASAGKVRLIVDAYTDSNVTNEKAFAINKVMTLS